MIGPAPGARVMVATRPVDFRKGADSLAALVAAEKPHHGPEQDEIDPRRKRERRGVVGDRTGQVGGMKQLSQRHDRGKRGQLYHLDGVRDQVGQDIADGLGQDHAAPDSPAREPNAHAGIGLGVRDGLDPGPYDLGDIRGADERNAKYP